MQFSALYCSDMTKLSPGNVIENCRTAFDAAEKLGIPRVIEPRDMNLLAVPDKLAVMTYLYQLRAHFTGHQLEVQSIGKHLLRMGEEMVKLNGLKGKRTVDWW